MMNLLIVCLCWLNDQTTRSAEIYFSIWKFCYDGCYYDDLGWVLFLQHLGRLFAIVEIMRKWVTEHNTACHFVCESEHCRLQHPYEWKRVTDSIDELYRTSCGHGCGAGKLLAPMSTLLDHLLSKRHDPPSPGQPPPQPGTGWGQRSSHSNLLWCPPVHTNKHRRNHVV